MLGRVVRLLLTLTALLGAAPALHAAPIVNTAILRYTQGTVSRTTSSNTITLMTELPPTPAQLGFLRHTPSSTDGAKVPADGGQCRLSGGFAAIDLPNAPADLDLEQVPLQPTRTFRGGDLVFVRLKDGNRNLDPLSRELVEIRLATGRGDEEVLRLRETGQDSAEFIAPIATVTARPAKLDCRLSVDNGTSISASYVDEFYPTDIGVTEALIDPYGYVFSSEDGAPVNGATVTLLNASGQLAEAFGDDGLSEPYPATVTTGGSVSTGARTYRFPTGGFRFPLLRAGAYQLVVVPPPGYRWPSAIAPRQLSLLVGPDGQTFVINPFNADLDVAAGGSYGGGFPVTGPAPIKIDLPVDPLRGSLVLAKNASTGVASIGDFIRYEVTLTNRNRVMEQRNALIVDTLPSGFRYRPGSLRINDVKAPDPQISADGRILTVPLGTMAAGASRKVGYVTQVGPGTPYGEAINQAEAHAEDSLSASNRAAVGVRIVNGFFSDALTIVGRVAEGVCGTNAKIRPGIGSIRLILEDGRFTLTDEDGQYHFEGVRPGTHVVQIDLATLPEGYEAVQCIRNTRTAGRAFSQFVEGQGGSLLRADFFLRRKEGAAAAAPEKVMELAAADGETGKVDWFADATPHAALLFPAPDHNPRAPVTRVVVRHTPNQRVRVTINGVLADALSFDGIETSADNSIAISTWRALPLHDGENLIRAEVIGAGAPQVFETRIHYSNTATRATFVPERSKLVADGRTRPVIAVRITDRSGKPVRAGLTGGFRVRPPYQPATSVDAQQERRLAGLDRFDPTWRVLGDDGIALVELEPTTQAGTAELDFDFEYDRQKRTDEIRAWLQPAARDWMVVGFAAGTIGFNTLSKNTETLADEGRGETYEDGQVTLYAKGRIKGEWVLTLAYDSERGRKGPDGRRSLLRVIDPDRYYTVYGDTSVQGHDAASSEKLYLRLERPQFYALFGDYETGLTGSELGAYSRTLTGAKAEYRGASVAASAFIADTDLGYQRDEIQGNGLSGPYPLGRRDPIQNSEKVRIEVRDRYRSERVIDTRFLSRHIDYDIDYDAGTLLFREPVPSRDRQYNPVFIIIEYETEGTTLTYTNAGGRVVVEPITGRLQIGATAIRDEAASGTTKLGAVDVRLRPTERTEIRLEAAFSDNRIAGTNEAYVAEVEHRGETIDTLAYYRQLDTSFGVGQLSRSEGGTRKYGVDGRIRIARNLDAVANVYREEYLGSAASRDAAGANLEYRGKDTALRGGIAHADDTSQTGEELTSTLLQLGATQRLLGGKLDLSADTDFGIGSDGEESIDFPARYRIGGAYAIRPDLRLVARHEITDGEDFDSATTQFGIDASPWAGARLTSTLNQQDIGETSQRSFANIGLSQALLLGRSWGVDFSVDGSRTFNGRIDPEDVPNPRHPVAGGGYLRRNGITDDFIAFSAGTTYRSNLWSWNGRLEYRDADSGDQYGVTSSLLRQVENGTTLSAGLRAFRFDQDDGSTTTSVAADASVALRPIGSHWSVLDKLQIRLDRVENGVPGGYSPFGDAGLTLSGDGKSWRIINSFALNRVSGSWKDGSLDQRSQLSLFYGSKYVLSRFDAQDFKGYTHIVGLEVRLDLTSWLDVGLSGSMLHAFETDSLSFAIGPTVGISPLVNAWISLGYNIVGFRDRDFEGARYTREGFYIMMRLKLDQQTPQDLGLGGATE